MDEVDESDEMGPAETSRGVQNELRRKHSGSRIDTQAARLGVADSAGGASSNNGPRGS